MAPLTPVHFFSHGSTMMLGEESDAADYWKKAGDAALANKIKGVVMMGAHWDALGRASRSPPPSPGQYQDYKLNPDIEGAHRCIQLLRDAGIEANENPNFEWIHDTYLILIRMFPAGCPPTVLISMNFRFDPHLHMRVGDAVRSLRGDGYLIIGSGGAVHSLWRNRWRPMLRYSDNFAQEAPPEPWAHEFRQSVEDVMANSSGPQLRRAMTHLMKHPQYRDAHGTDDHFMAALFVAGAAGDEDSSSYGELKAETWELTNMCNSQFTIGSWPKTLATAA
ncbi:aromatic ring-opening dioxygenase [Microdochium bolleyi]|uniref:Aromatic ring-opening dioxygenase n=1 Tax=Microdochium bolleyi TaxID=196109 RepID=A0A136IJH0_9PEZI|nr:aromatic ring-opening dioxygenase [Microdochium bolleyi]